MLAVVIAVLAAGVAVVAMLVFARGSSGRNVPRVSGWLAFVSGTLAVLAVAAPLLQSRMADDGVDQLGRVAPWLLPASIALALVGVVAAVYGLARHHRSWRVWAGLVTAGLVLVFWLVFFVGELVSPH